MTFIDEAVRTQLEELAHRIEGHHWDVADKPAAARFAADLRAIAHQPAADPLVEWGNRPLNFTATVGTFNDGTQPAAVDEAYPTPRNRAEAVALARLALAHLGVIDAHIDAAIARCETNSAAQHGGSDNG